MTDQTQAADNRRSENTAPQPTRPPETRQTIIINDADGVNGVRREEWPDGTIVESRFHRGEE